VWTDRSGTWETHPCGLCAVCIAKPCREKNNRPGVRMGVGEAHSSDEAG
jgi:hypothetical protein